MFRHLVLGLSVLLSAGAFATSAAAQAASGGYIVVLKDRAGDPGKIAGEHGKAYGFTAKFVYRHAVRGYAATLPDAALAALRSRPEVLSVSEDREVWADVDQPPQGISFGVSRIDGDVSSTRSGDGKGSVNVNVAVLDNGIDASHPDLNVAGTTSCISRAQPNPSSDARDWHGTMVGGFIGAIDNEIGVVGVAPGARLWGVEVLDDHHGFGTNSEIICGLDWVLRTRADGNPTNDIQVVNMSLGGHAGIDTGTCPASANDAFHLAHCRVLAAGIVIVVSAGNESTDFRNVAPATYDEVLTATAMTDLDGEPGGLQPVRGPGSCSHALNQLAPIADDTAAFFSNFAVLGDDRAHAIAAPGVCIGSTYPGGLYAAGTGTSFAAPLVTGTVALCIASGPCAGLTPRQIVQKIVADAAAYNTSRKGTDYGFQGDPLRPISGKHYGYLIRAGLY